MTLRHSRSARSAPTPKVGSWSWSQLSTLAVRLPRSTSMTCPAPKRWPVRITAESTFCAGTVASHISGGFRQVSQLPQSPDSSSKYASSSAASARGGLGVAEHRVELHLVDPLVLGRAVGADDEGALLHDVGEAVGHPRHRPARRRGRRGRSPGSSPRGSWAGRRGRRSARRACRCPCRTRSSRPRSRRPRGGTAAARAARTSLVEPGVVGDRRRSPSSRSQLGDLARCACATGSRRCRPAPRKPAPSSPCSRKRSSCARASFFSSTT